MSYGSRKLCDANRPTTRTDASARRGRSIAGMAATAYPANTSMIEDPTERKVFTTLCAGLDSAWHVFSGVRGQVRRPGRSSVDWEVDLTLVHAEHGLLCFEVKGGKLSYSKGTWFQGSREMLKDPVAQARQAAYDLRRQIASEVGTTERELPVAFGLVFPDGHLSSKAALPSGLLRSQVLDGGVFSHPSAIAPAIKRLADERGLSARIPPHRFERILASLAPSGTVQPQLVREVVAAEAVLLSFTLEQVMLTDEQLDAQVALEEVVHACVLGPAGTGKTLLAIHRARRLALAGRHPLFVTPDGDLFDWLHDSRMALSLDGVELTTVRRLQRKLYDQTGMLPYRSISQDEAERWDNTMHGEGAWLNALGDKSDDTTELSDDVGVEGLGPYQQGLVALFILEAASRLQTDDLPDALVVDEAQAFETDLLDALQGMLHDPSLDPVYLFADPYQRMEGGLWREPAGYSFSGIRHLRLGVV
jgi:hypothetical protein